MIIMVRAAMKTMQITNYDMFDDGDDCLVLMEEEDFATFRDSVGPTFLDYGQEIKVENVARTMEEIEWCQCHPVLGADGRYQMVANWKKTLSQACAGTHHWDTGSPFDMAFSVGQCITAVYPRMPILWQFTKQLCAQGSMHRDLINTDWIFKLKGSTSKLGSLVDSEPTAESRASFADAFGVDEIEQLRIEQRLANWWPTAGMPVDCGDTQVGADWGFTYPPGCTPTERDILPLSQ